MGIETFIIIFIVYLILCFWLYHLGESRKMRGWKLGLISLFFTPIIGFIVFYFAPSRMIVLEKRYICPECKYEFTNQAKFCPICLNNGKEVELQEVSRNMV